MGGDDDVVIELNERAVKRFTGDKQFSIVPGATHLFEEPGMLDQVIAAASEWLQAHLPEGES